jgi:hypothetical protein
MLLFIGVTAVKPFKYPLAVLEKDTERTAFDKKVAFVFRYVFNSGG